MKWFAQYQARKHLGDAAPGTDELDSGNDAPLRLYYFHAPDCGPCQAMMPMIDRLCAEHPNLIKVDVTEHTQLAERFGVSATPTFVVVNNGQVSDIKVGAQRQPWIEHQLTGR